MPCSCRSEVRGDRESEFFGKQPENTAHATDFSADQSGCRRGDFREGLGHDGRQPLRRADAHLLVDAKAPKNDRDVLDAHAKLRREKPDHVIGRAAGDGHGRHAHAELGAEGLSNRVFAGVGRAEDIQDERVALHRAKAVHRKPPPLGVFCGFGSGFFHARAAEPEAAPTPRQSAARKRSRVPLQDFRAFTWAQIGTAL